MLYVYLIYGITKIIKNCTNSIFNDFSGEKIVNVERGKMMVRIMPLYMCIYFLVTLSGSNLISSSDLDIKLSRFDNVRTYIGNLNYSKIGVCAVTALVLINAYNHCFGFKNQEQSSREEEIKENQSEEAAQYLSPLRVGSLWVLNNKNKMVKIQGVTQPWFALAPQDMRPDEIEKSKEEIISNPVSLLERNQAPLDKYRKAFISVKECAGLAQLRQIATDIRLENKGNPFWMFNECYGLSANGVFCSLNRLYDLSESRNKFEKKIFEEVENQSNIDEIVVWTDIGSGDLFQNLVLITKIFEKNKKPIFLNGVFIDPHYKDCIKGLKWLHKKAHNPDIDFSGYYTVTSIRVNQLLRWVEKVYPQHTLNIFLYDSLDKYAKDSAEKNLKTNIYTGIDLEGEEKLSVRSYLKEHAETDARKAKKGREEYLSGLKGILKPHGVGFLLSKDYLDSELNEDGELIEKGKLTNYCLKILAANAPRPDDSQLMNLNKETLFGRYVVLADTYST